MEQQGAPALEEMRRGAAEPARFERLARLPVEVGDGSPATVGAAFLATEMGRWRGAVQLLAREAGSRKDREMCGNW